MNNNYRSPSIVNAMGIALLGAIAGATAVILSDETNRTRLRRKWRKFMDEGNMKFEEGAKKIKELKDKSRRKLGQELEKTGQKILS